MNDCAFIHYCLEMQQYKLLTFTVVLYEHKHAFDICV